MYVCVCMYVCMAIELLDWGVSGVFADCCDVVEEAIRKHKGQ